MTDSGFWTDDEHARYGAATRTAQPSMNGDGPTGDHEPHWLAGAPMDPAASSTEPLPALPGFPFLHRGSGSVIVGPTGTGRSSLLEAGLYDAALAGVPCAYLGSEVTEPEFNARAAILAGIRGDTIDDELRAQLARVRYLNLSSVIAQAWVDPEAWARDVAVYEIVAMDPLSAVASALDLDFDKSNADYVRFYDRLVQPVTAVGVAVTMADNIGHAADAKSRAKGASAKSDRADLTFSCTLAANPAGLIIHARKVRTVRAAFSRGDEWLFVKSTQSIEPHASAAGGGEDRPAFRPTVLMERVSKFVEGNAGVSIRAIREGIQSKARNVDLAIVRLVTEGFLERRQDGQAQRHTSVRPYRRADDQALSTGGGE